MFLSDKQQCISLGMFDDLFISDELEIKLRTGENEKFNEGME
jgi:hypothetical protein